MSIRYTFREWKLSDKESLIQYANNLRVSENLRDTFPYPYTETAADQWLHIATSQKSPIQEFAIDIDGSAVGGVGVVVGSGERRIAAEVGYWLGEPFWGKGIMTRVVTDFLDYVFHQFPDVIKLTAPIYARNMGSQGVIKKVGFSLESVEKCGVIKQGELLDLCHYRLFRVDWEKLKKSEEYTCRG